MSFLNKLKNKIVRGGNSLLHAARNGIVNVGKNTYHHRSSIANSLGVLGKVGSAALAGGAVGGVPAAITAGVTAAFNSRGEIGDIVKNVKRRAGKNVPREIKRKVVKAGIDAVARGKIDSGQLSRLRTMAGNV